ncbi:hypothetical protein ACO2Q3_12200 [Caulobacter sp. KR2-114]|uniref:hypothetical protein n=1 Tax=Caulobacter sp. KR2-114 TaxID=3400912 RepID=UPI003C0DAFE2
MRLIDLLARPDLLDDDDGAIYVARPWRPEAEALVVSPAPDGTEPISLEGTPLEYFLETYLAHEFLEDFAESDAGAGADPRQACERLIRYAQADA